ncbi:CAP domain-containing protein [Pedobacter psychroterrae]|uniref:CAP domain-containing protein n=1 Tax=Pedobacter psychroterrae TaxID=2530453 RepID=A0A4R0NJK9_9SPHI|nr:CAP domain-containing protein [Pedobacter psychroterrae]TCD00871.1 CAP domain-containing protein [Pedobacter psychroterrae]
MSTISLILFFTYNLLLPFGSTSRSQAENSWSKEELKSANTAGDVKYLSGEEKDMIIYMNLVRMDGEKFFNTYFQDFVTRHNTKMQQYSNYNEVKISRTDKYYKSLEKDLKEVKGLPPFWPDEAMSWVARQHAKDMNSRNYAAHSSLDGKTVRDRIGNMYPRKACGENLAFGYAGGMDNICMLLLDKGVANLGHRKVILDTDYKFNFVGVSIQPHKGYKYCSVTDFVSLPR